MSSLFKVAESTTAFFKGGIFGFQGSGKTFTLIEIMIGLYKYLRETAKDWKDKPIYFSDTETGSDWAIPRFKKEGIEFRVAKTRAFSDLCDGIKEAEQEGFGMCVDSATHYWRELCESYQRKNNIKRMMVYHWGPLKEEWSKFTELIVNSNLHIMVAGRAGWEYDMEEAEDGKKDLIKTGTKMKAEGEFGFEPSLVLEMQRIRVARDGTEIGDTPEGKKKGRISAKIGDKVVHRCHVIKDRRMDEKSLDGKSFDDPVFNDFTPHMELLNFGGDHIGVDSSRTSDGMFDDKTGDSWTHIKKMREIYMSDIQQLLMDLYPGRTAADQKAKADLLELGTGTRNWTRIEKLARDFPPEFLQEAHAKMVAYSDKTAEDSEPGKDAKKTKKDK